MSNNDLELDTGKCNSYHKQIIASQLYERKVWNEFTLTSTSNINIKYKWIRMRSRNLEVEDDGPDESQHNGGTSVHNVSSVDVHQLDLGERWSEMDGVSFKIDLR